MKGGRHRLRIRGEIRDIHDAFVTLGCALLATTPQLLNCQESLGPK